MSKTSSHQKFFFFFLYDLSKGLRNGGVVSIPLSSLVPSASKTMASCLVLSFTMKSPNTTQA
jgi:hypothetical protein